MVRQIEVWDFQDRSADLFKGFLIPFLKLNKKQVYCPRGVQQKRIKVSMFESIKKTKALSENLEKLRKIPDYNAWRS